MQIINSVTLLDGGAVVELQMSYEELQMMAKIGIIEVLTEAAKSYDTVDAEYAHFSEEVTNG